ncbi:MULTISPECIES: hypothetical protein [unclassified Providencia]|uniref:hypothetical protein n=1 Tax=unclassified Providencia TaxID=2633465 RepID=UPI00234A852F|nr:hypothetical protein [Providencia sp. PROV239]HEM6855864.1 hypothetical protein [Providencia rettgeri]
MSILFHKDHNLDEKNNCYINSKLLSIKKGHTLSGVNYLNIQSKLNKKLSKCFPRGTAYTKVWQNELIAKLGNGGI